MSELQVKVHWDESTRIAVDPATQPYWEGGKAGKLLVARCGHCGSFRMPPLPFCAHCHSQAIDWVESSGKVELYSYTVCQKKGKGDDPGFQYIPALVEVPDSGRVRLTGNLLGLKPTDIRIGMALEVAWVPMADGWCFPAFVPA